MLRKRRSVATAALVVELRGDSGFYHSSLSVWRIRFRAANIPRRRPCYNSLIALEFPQCGLEGVVPCTEIDVSSEY